MIETRFRDTAIGKIPEDWSIRSLNELCSKITDGSHESPKEAEFGYYMPSVKDMSNRSFDFCNCKIISESDYLKLVNNGCQPQIGDVVIAKDGSILKYSFAIRENLPIVILSSIAIIRPIGKIIDSEFLALFFRQPKFIDKVLSDFKTGTGVPRIVLKNFEKIEVSFPPSFKEQSRIASAFTSIDNLISSLEKLIEKKKNIKQGTMQQLFTGKKRLKGFIEPWGIKSFKDSFLIIGNNCYSREELTTVGKVLNVHYGDVLIKFGAVIDVKKDQLPYIIGKDIASHPLKDGDIIMADTAEDETCGKVCEIIGINNLQVESGLHTIALRPLDVYGERFLGYFMNSSAFHDLLLPLMQGTKVTSISKSALMDVSFIVPSSIEEQTAIASVLYSMDNEINALECKKTKYESIKQGMMKQLLTGKIRLI